MITQLPCTGHVYITKLRKKLKDDPTIEIINIHGKGYKLIAPDAETEAK